MTFALLLRWSLRDLRRRWLQVVAIALVIAVGTGVYSALAGTAAWRYRSNDASFDVTGMYDLRVRATPGLDAPEGAMLQVLDRLADPTIVRRAEERLVVDVPVDATKDDRSIRVPGRMIGLDVTAGPMLTSTWVPSGAGRAVTAGDAGRDVAVLEQKFADHYGLTAGTTIRVGRTAVEIVGIGLAPEYFIITTDEGGFFAQANFAAVFTTLTTAQTIAGRPGRVNDLVLTLRDGVPLSTARAEVAAAFEASGLALGETVMTRHDEVAYEVLYDDIEGDRRFWNVLAGLVLAGAAFGTFNLSSRMVESQRRELGIGLALGASRRQLAWRPLLVGAEIAVAGVVLGIGMGVLTIELLRPVFQTMLPLPRWYTAFQWGTFARGAALGFAVPMVATAWPVARIVRLSPVQAMSTTRHVTRGGMAPLLRKLPWPRATLRRMPLGNALRAPRRTILTALGIGAAIATLVAVLGMIDSFLGTVARYERQVIGRHPDRVVVTLDGIVPESDETVVRIADAPWVGDVTPVLQLGGHLATGSSTGFDVSIVALSFGNDVWNPTVRGSSSASGVVIARAAAEDLHIDVGDTVALTHPVRTADGLATTTSTVLVVGVHPSPFRSQVFLDRSGLGGLGAAGLTNELFVLPADGVTVDDVERVLFGSDGVASAVAATTSIELVRDSIDDYTGVLRVMEGFMLLLALLIAYNTSSINADERTRERATMFAFGLPVRRVLVLEVVEGLVYGILGTIVGLLLGSWITHWLVTGVLKRTVPDMTMETSLSAGTIATAFGLGVIAVAAAPLLTARRLRRMDIPSALRVVE